MLAQTQLSVTKDFASSVTRGEIMPPSDINVANAGPMVLIVVEDARRYQRTLLCHRRQIRGKRNISANTAMHGDRMCQISIGVDYVGLWACIGLMSVPNATAVAPCCHTQWMQRPKFETAY